jgi:hypothetical protein
MDKLTRNDLYSLEQYAELRPEFRARVIAHKKDRNVHIGPVATVYFEDRQTVQYQIQEMLRVERIFEAAGIEEELEAYNPLIPDGSNWKATFMIEEPDVDKRRQPPVYAIADEDLERDTEEKTSSVHFLRFELTPAMVEAAKAGAAISVGIDHENYSHTVSPLAAAIRESLLADLA